MLLPLAADAAAAVAAGEMCCYTHTHIVIGVGGKYMARVCAVVDVCVCVWGVCVKKLVTEFILWRHRM